MSKVSKIVINVIVVALLLGCVFLIEFYSDEISDFLHGFESTLSSKSGVHPDVEFGDNDSLAVHFIDVGQAKSILVENENGDFTLIDAGSNDSEPALLKYLESCGVDELEYFILTHPHADHIGGADAVLQRYTAKKVLMPYVTTNTSSFNRLLNELEKATTTEIICPEPGDTYTFGNCEFTVLSPRNPSSSDLNNASIVTRLVCGNVSVLFTGDAEKKIEKVLLDSDYILDSDLLDVGHHGSSTSSTKKFVQAVSPSLAVISCAQDNDYNHPHSETLKCFDELGVPYLRTDTNGSVVVVFDKDGLMRITCSKQDY